MGDTSLPTSWARCLLSDVVDYGQTQSVVPEEIPTGAWILELEDIEKNSSRLLQRVKSDQRRPKSVKSKFEAGDVLYSRLRPYLNKVLLADQDGYCTPEIIPLKSTVAVRAAYLFYALKRPEFLEYVTSASHGLNMPRLGSSAARRAPFVLAPINEQQRIADKCDILRARLASCQERLDRIPGILSRLRDAVLRSATSGALSENWRLERGGATWETVSLESVAEDFAYGTSAKSAKSGDIPVLRMGNIQGGKLDWTDLAFTSDRAEIEKYMLKSGDVLFNRTNSPELVGKTAVYHGERPAIFAGYLIRVRCGDRLLPDYLAYCLNSPAGREYRQHVKSDGVNQSNINATKLAAFTFKLPPVDEQRVIIERAQTFLAHADRVEASYIAGLSRLEGVEPAILAKAFLGELVPQNPADEPAEVLLHQMRAVRSQAVAVRSPRQRSQTKGRSRVKELVDVLSEAGDWLEAQEAFRRCGVSDGAETTRLEALYAELRTLDQAGRLETSAVRDEKGRKLHDLLKLTSGI